MKTIIIMGSTSDEPHAKKITDKLDEYGITWEQHAASAHKQPLKVLEILEVNKNEKNIVYITIAGRSNALSGFVAANSEFPTIGCPPFSDKSDKYELQKTELISKEMLAIIKKVTARKTSPD